VTRPTNNIIHVGLRLPDGRWRTMAVESDQSPSMLTALRALRAAQQSLQGQRSDTAIPTATPAAKAPPRPVGLRTATAKAKASPLMKRSKRKPTLASLTKAARRAGIEPASFEIKPDGSIVVAVGKNESIEETNPWLAHLRKD
jgi:hypothetical protein